MKKLKKTLVTYFQKLKMNMPVYNSFMTTVAVGGHVCVAASFEVVPGYLVFLELNCNKKKKWITLMLKLPLDFNNFTMFVPFHTLLMQF